MPADEAAGAGNGLDVGKFMRFGMLEWMPAGGPGGGLLEMVPLPCRMIGDNETNGFRWA